jgi:RNA polymerase sigma-70 factor (ECF subfamily)
VQEINPVWILQAHKGDPEAFTKLVERFEKPVFNLCYRLLGNAEDAEDSAQETFIRAYQSMHRYDVNRSFGTWLLSIAAHHCIDQLRRRKCPVISLEDLSIPDLPESSPGPEIRSYLIEDQQQVRNLLQVLDPIDKAIVVMFYWYEFSHEEICQSLSLSTSAVKSRLHRARRAMAHQWMKGKPNTLITERMVHESQSI